MDEMQWLRSVGSEAQTSPDVDVDVAESVMRTLREQQFEPARSVPMFLTIAIGSWAIAGLSIFAAQQAIAAMQNPLGDLLRL